MNRLVYHLDSVSVEEFLSRYPRVRTLIDPTLQPVILKGYKKFLKKKNTIGVEEWLGAKPDVKESDAFGRKTFWKFNWGTCTGHWGAVYQYLYNQKYNIKW